MKNFLFNILLVFSFNITNIYAQKVFFNSASKINTPSIANVLDIDMGDINGDTKVDLIIASKSNNSIYWIDNNKNSNNYFGELETITTNFYNAGIIKLKDIDNDGDLDFFVAGYRNDNISWFENINNGQRFSQHYIPNNSNGITSFTIFDIDQDGDSDLVVSYWEGHKISFFENKNSEFIEEKTIDSTTGLVSQIIDKDADGDGLGDIFAIQEEKNRIVYYKNSPDSTRFSEMNIIIDSLNEPSAFAIDDIDSDGDYDIILAERNKVVSFTNNNGFFNAKKQILDNNYSIQDILLVDLNNDNHKDIIIGNSENGEVLKFINDGSGNYSEKNKILENFDGAYAISIADINDDNVLDICVASYYLNKIVWLPGSENSNSLSPVLINESQLQEPIKIISADFAGDSLSDIIVSNFRSNSLSLYKNKNKGENYEFNILDHGSDPKERFIVRADLNNDGRNDIVEAKRNLAYFTLTWYKNLNEFGDFDAFNILVNNLPPVRYLAIADINGDSYEDIIIVSETYNSIAYIKNIGEGKFDKNLKIISDNIQNPTMVIADDFNNDGTIDIIVSSYLSNSINLLTNKNNIFTLEELSIPNPLNKPNYISSGDLDNDGYIDIVFASLSDYALYWMQNEKGKFSKPIKVNPTYYSAPEKIIIEDIDNDKDNDIIIMNKNYQSVSWFENISGNGDFSFPKDIINGIKGLIDIEITDINNDNLSDVLSLSKDENNLYLNIAELAPLIIKHPLDTTICDTQDITLNIDFDKADSIRWQTMEKYLNYFESIHDDSIYQGTSSKHLKIRATPDLDSYKYRCVLFYNDKVFFSDTATLTIYNKIEAYAGDNDTTCNSFYFLNGNNSGAGYGIWTVFESNASIEEPNNNYTKAENLSMGNNIFKWTIINGICSDSDKVVIFKEDSIKILQQPESINIAKGTDAHFKITTNSEGLFQWYLNGYRLNDNNKILGSTTSELTILEVDSTDAGNYRCYVEGYCNYTYSDIATLDIITSTNELAFNQLNLYPNPVKNKLNISNGINIRNIEVYNINGSKVNDIIQSNNQIDLTNLKAGIYFIRILSDKNIFYHKITKI